MSTYEDPTIAELEAQMNSIHAEIDTKLSNCSKIIAKLDTRHNDDNQHHKKADVLLAAHKVAIIAPHIVLAAEKLPEFELKLKVAEYELKRKTDECTRLTAKHLDACKSEIRTKKEKKQLTKTVESLTAQLEGKVTPEERNTKTENEELKQELAKLRAQLENKIEECEMKDQVIVDLTEDFAAYQSVTSNTWAHRHDSCNELNDALEEQCAMLTAERDTLQRNLQGDLNAVQGNYEILSVKHDVLAMKRDELIEERDNLQNKFNVRRVPFLRHVDISLHCQDALKAHQKELDRYSASQCEGSSSCTACPMHLKRALRISKAAEAQALQLVDQVNHDRMVAWNQLHEHQTRVVQEHYAAVESWVSARQAPSVSPTLVSPTFRSGEDGEQGWKITATCGSSEDGSVDFVL
ncbi:hypothetical protein EKO04_000370 [Ascochyta lentis]|uniref:Uncharacterized protein n=1 Tax=Ascochyta lentis TaxID=205686 RepID=A0A8H7MN82_9PLEO|nr:hypothetical protein EKO04_000370 [Ascochyta lentis]